MSILEIKNCFDPVLRKKCNRVENIDDDLVRLTQDMIETMFRASGAGLAANQIGVPSSLFVVDMGVQSENPDPVIMINPVITLSDELENGEEGCLSIPDILAEVPRSLQVEVKGYDINGKEIRYEVEGYLARAFQHEMDHLNGVLFWDKLGKVRRDILRRKFKKKLRDLET